MADRLKRMMRMLIECLTSALAIILIYVILSLIGAVFGFWPATIAGIAAIFACFWIAAGEEDDG